LLEFATSNFGSSNLLYLVIPILEG